MWWCNYCLFFCGVGEGLTIWVVPIVLEALALNLCLKTVRFAHDVRRLNYVHVLMCPKGSWSVWRTVLLVFSPRFLEAYIPNNAREDWKLLTPENYDRTCFHIEALSLFSLHSCELIWLVTIFHQQFTNHMGMSTPEQPRHTQPLRIPLHGGMRPVWLSGRCVWDWPRAFGERKHGQSLVGLCHQWCRQG